MTFPSIDDYRKKIIGEFKTTPKEEKSKIISDFLARHNPIMEKAALFPESDECNYFHKQGITTLTQALEHVGIEINQDLLSRQTENCRYTVNGQNLVRFSKSGEVFGASDFLPDGSYLYWISRYLKLIEQLMSNCKLINDTEAAFEIRGLRNEIQ